MSAGAVEVILTVVVIISLCKIALYLNSSRSQCIVKVKSINEHIAVYEDIILGILHFKISITIIVICIPKVEVSANIQFALVHVQISAAQPYVAVDCESMSV